MLASGELAGSERISIDRRSWKPLGLLIGAPPPSPQPRPPAPPAAATAVGRPTFIDLPGGGDLTLDAPGATAEVPATSHLLSAKPKRDEHQPADTRGRSPKIDDREMSGDPGSGGRADGAEVDLSLELVERRPHVRSAPAQSPSTSGPPVDGSAVPDPVSLRASSRGAAPSPDTQPTEADPTLPVSIEGAPGDRKAARPRTVTAARAGNPAGKTTDRKRTLRLVVPIAAVAGIGALAAVTIVADLPARLRPEPQAAAVLGALAEPIARDRFSAYSQGARKLEEAVANRLEAPGIRAEAAFLLASSVVLHGGERGRLTRAEALLPPDEAHDPKIGAAAVSVTRARAWVALGRMRFNDAMARAETPGLPSGDVAAIHGWVALARHDGATAETAFTEAERATPAAGPSKVAARFGLGLAHESAFSPLAAETFRAVLADAPAHVGASLGLMRTLPMGAAGRLKLAQELVATRAGEASPAELAEAHTRIGEAFQELGDLTAAEAALARARQADPSSVALAVVLGDRALAEGRRDDAFASYKGTLAAPPATPRSAAFQFARVGALIEAGRLDEAAQSVARLERGLPHDPRAPYWRGQLAERRQPPDFDTAARSYEEALKRSAKFVPASLELARLHLGQHRAADALAVLERAEAQGATPVALHVALGEALLASGNPTEAVRVFRQAVADDGASVAAHLGFASALYGSGNAGAAAAEVTALAGRRDAATMGSRSGDRIAELLVKLGRRDEALALYEATIAARRATPSTKVSAARLALERGQLELAQKLAAEAVDEDPRTPGALFALGEVLRQKGDLAGAIAELRRAQAIDAAPEVQLEYGRLLASMGRDEEAMAALAEAGELPKAGVERGRIDLRRGNTEKAAEELAAATLKLPTDPDAFLLLGQAEDRLGRGAQAEAAFKTTTRLAPASGEAHYRLGRLLLDRGAVAAALPHLRATVEHLPPAASWRADAYFQLGFAEQRQGSRERAVAAFRRYLELAPGDAPARAEVMKQLGEDDLADHMR